MKKRDSLLPGNKLIEKMPDPGNDKEHYHLHIRKKSTKSVNQSKMITYQPKAFKKPNIVDIKSIITEYPKTSHKLSKAIRQAEKVGSTQLARPNIAFREYSLSVTSGLQFFMTFRHPFKGKDFLKSCRWKSCFCIKIKWFDNNKCWYFWQISVITK